MRRQKRRSDFACLIQGLELRRLLSTIYVDAIAPGPTHNGSSWANAYTDLQQALSGATSGATIEVAQGTYNPTSSTNRNISFQLKNGVAVYGGYAGYGAANPDARDVAAYPTILSGDIGAAGKNADDTYSVVVASNTTSTAVLDGFTITAGNAYGPGDGGGLYINAGSPTINNCTFTGNTAPYGGGAYISGQTALPFLTSCTFEGNTAEFGAGVCVETFANPTISDSIFTNNAAVSVPYEPAYGGGVAAINSSLTATDCMFTNNTANTGTGINSEDSGGGAYIYEGDSDFGNLEMTDCTFTSNAATKGGGMYDSNTGYPGFVTGCMFSDNSGGGLYGQYSYAPMTDCSFLGNSLFGADDYSGSISNSTFEANIGGAAIGCAKLDHCNFLDNQNTGQGEAIVSGGTITNSIFTDNSALGGAGALFRGVELVNCIVEGNQASTLVQGGYDTNNFLYNCTFAGNSCGYVAYGPIMSNCIVWDNTDTSGGAIYNEYGETDGYITYCDIQGGYPIASDINVDPLFLQNPNPGPDGVWGSADDDYGNLQISPASPCVDAGNNSAVPAGVTMDYAGNSRFQDVPTSGHTGSGTVPIVDMGAYEAAPALAASAGGPYDVLVGQSLMLDGRGASSVAGPLQYAWDWTGNGLFNDASMANPTFPVGQFVPGSVVNVALKVTDASGQSTISDTTVRIMPTTIYVDPAAPGANDGVDWNDAFTSLADALNLSLPGQTIRVAQGTYTPTPFPYPAISFVLQNDVQLFGGYVGYGAANPDARDPLAFPSILSGDLGMVGGSMVHSSSVITSRFNDAGTVLDGFTVTGANGNAGIYTYRSNPIINDCIITGNSSTGYGGGISMLYGTPTVSNCEFIENSAKYGGAASADGYLGTFTNCIFEQNRAVDGGAIYVDYETPAFVNCQFLGNTATDGGAIYDTDPLGVPFTNCIFSGNAAAAGGAFWIGGEELATITNCTLAGNYASSTGGAIYLEGRQFDPPYSEMSNSIIWDNSSPAGPGIFNTRSYPNASGVMYSDIQGGFAGEDNDSADPQFIRNPSPGPDGIWGTADDDYGDLHLQLTSPCIDSGLNAAVPSGVTTDLDGDPRIFDFPGVDDPGAIVDRGAYELGYNLDQLTVPAGQTVTLPAGGYPFAVNSLSIGVGGTLNIADDTLTIQDVINPSFVTSSIIGDINNGTGYGIVSTSAGFNSSPFTSIAYFEDGSQTTIGRTWLGDANLDRQINADDLTLLLLGQVQNGTRWQDGNFNYDNQVNADDWMELATALAYSKGQPLSTFGYGASIQTSAMSTLIANQPKLAAPQFATAPIVSDENLSGLLDSSQWFGDASAKNDMLI